MSLQEFCEGDFGDEYHKRNRVDWRRRMKFWGQILDLTGARSVWEWGCGPGWNLTAIQACHGVGTDWDDSDVYRPWSPEVCGTECNESAIEQAQIAGLDVYHHAPDYEFELAMTVGALIHVAPEDLQDVMQMIIDRSSDYVLAVEYFNETPKEIEYHGQKGKLWAMDYGKKYQQMGLKLIAQGGAGDGFDDCTFWLLRK